MKKITIEKKDNGTYSISKSKQEDISGNYYQSTDVDERIEELEKTLKYVRTACASSIDRHLVEWSRNITKILAE